MTRLTIRDWLAVLIGSAVGIGWSIWAILYSKSYSGNAGFLAILFSPYLAALITGLTAKQNERTLSGITILIVYYGLIGIVSYPLIQHHGWDDFWGFHKWYIVFDCFMILGIYPLGRAIGYLAVKLKGRKQIEQDIYLDFDKKIMGYFSKIRKKQS